MEPAQQFVLAVTVLIFMFWGWYGGIGGTDG